MTSSFPVRTVAVVTYGGGHVTMVVPVIQMLAAAGMRVVVLGLTTASAALAKEGIPHLGFRDLLQPGDSVAIAMGERLAEGVSSSVVPREETVAYLGLSYVDLEARVGGERAANAYARLGRQAFLPTTVMERWLRDLAPDLVIATNAPRAERAAIVAAGNLGIPSVCIVDLFALQEVEWIGRPGFADRVCVLSEGVRRMMVEAGRKPDEIVVTGNPAFDRLAEPSLACRGAELRTAKGWGRQRVILWASQPEPELHPFSGAPGNPQLPRLIAAALVDAVSKRREWTLVLRPHPSEPPIAGVLPERVERSGREDDLAALIAGVDLVVTMTSTVGLEAALIGRPVLAVAGSVFTADAPYAEMGIAAGVGSIAEIDSALVSILDHGVPTLRGGLRPAGGAAEAVTKEVLGLLRTRPPAHG